jgi:hypothetical protein
MYEGKESLLIGLLDRRLVLSDQMLRDVFGTITINDWWNGGLRNWSGVRTTDSPYYSLTSQHTYGRASDKIFLNSDEYEVQEWVKVHWKELGITRMEIGVSWVHTDICNISGNNLITFKT